MTYTASEYLTPSETALELDVSASTVTRWVREGYIAAGRTPGLKGRIRITRREVERVRGDLANKEPVR